MCILPSERHYLKGMVCIKKLVVRKGAKLNDSQSCFGSFFNITGAMRQLPSVSLTHTFSLNSLKLSKSSNQVCHEECIQTLIQMCVWVQFHTYLCETCMAEFQLQLQKELSYDRYKALLTHQLINQPINQMKVMISGFQNILLQSSFFFVNRVCSEQQKPLTYLPLPSHSY